MYEPSVKEIKDKTVSDFLITGTKTNFAAGHDFASAHGSRKWGVIQPCMQRDHRVLVHMDACPTRFVGVEPLLILRWLGLWRPNEIYETGSNDDQAKHLDT